MQISSQLPSPTAAIRRRTPGDADRLRWGVCLSFAARQMGLSMTEIMTRLVEAGHRRSNILERIDAGSCPDIRTIARLEKWVPGILALHRECLFRLLNPKPIKASTILECLHQLCRAVDDTDEYFENLSWWFDDKAINHYRPNYRSLYALRWNPLFAFSFNVAMVRLTESKRADQVHFYHCAWMIRGMHVLGMLPHFENHFHEIGDLASQLRENVYSTFLMMRVDWNAIEQQWHSKKLAWSLGHDDFGAHLDPAIDPVSELTNTDHFWNHRNDLGPLPLGDMR